MSSNMLFDADAKKDRNLTVDSLRAIAALTVLISHVLGEIWENYFSLGSVGVILFFLISGYCIVLSLNKLGDRPVKNFLVRRFFRLYPIYWCAVVFTVIVSHKNISWHQFLYNLTMFQNKFNVQHLNEVFWTLHLELYFYAIVAVLLAIGYAYKKDIYVNMSLAFLSLALVFAIERLLIGSGPHYGTFMFLSIFFLGGWVATRHLNNAKLPILYLLMVGYLVVVF